jgi:excisionase family DNA binding protein
MNAHHPITATLGDFSRLTGLGRSTIYALLNERRLDSIKVGKRRLIVLDSYRRLVEAQRGAAIESGQPMAIGDQTMPPRRGRPRKAAASEADNALPDNAPPIDSGVVNTC